MKIQLVNSPFDFDEVGEKTAQRWIRQRKAHLTPQGLVFKSSFTLSVQRRDREDELFNMAVSDSCSTRVWKSIHSGETVPSGGPECKVKQFVPIVPGIGVSHPAN